MKRLCMGLLMLGLVGTASAQLGSPTDSPACCQLTTSLVQDVVYGQDVSSDERALGGEGMPTNIHFLLDVSGSMRELPQITNSSHSTFFNITTNGCDNPLLDATEASRGWNPNFQYPVPDTGTWLGSDTGFPNLFRDDKFYGYMYWNDSNDPAYQWDNQEQVCQSQITDWNGTNRSIYNRCVECLSTKGYWKLPGATARDTAPLTNLNFIFWGRFLNFNPPKYVTAKAVLKSIIKDLRRARVGISHFANASNPTLTVLLQPQNPSCSQILGDPNAFDSNRASYINAVNTLTFTTGTPLARSLLNVGYYFTSDRSIYETTFGFGSAYSYPNEFKNGPLTSEGRSICWGCQGTTVVIISDGEPTGDAFSATMAARMRTVNNGPVYCPDTMPCASGSTASSRDKGDNETSYTDDNANYYLDDVAKMLHEQDLQRNTPPVVGNFDTSGKQSLRIFTVGFGIQSNLLRNAAAVGGGQYFTTTDAASLKQALQTIINTPNVKPPTTTFSPASVDSQPTAGPAWVLVPRLKPSANPSAPWQGFLYRFRLMHERYAGCSPLDPSAGGDLTQDGDCDDTLMLDAEGDAVTEAAEGSFVKLLDPFTPAVPFWEAGSVLKPSSAPGTRWQTRRIYTIIDTNGDGRMDHQDSPVEFTEANAPLLREYLGLSQNPSACDELAAQLGVASLTPDECARLVIRWYRGADALNPDPALRNSDRPFLLQDIFHSMPINVEPPLAKASCGFSSQCLSTLFSGATAMRSDYTVPNQSEAVDAYDKYVYEAGDRDKVILVGSNGGMLHAFLGGRRTGDTPVPGRPLYDNGTGQELWAFIPPDLLPKLRPNVGKHAYFVDGTAMVRDVWLDGAEGQPADGQKQWQEYRTVAVVGTGRGGVHRFALDLTRVLGLTRGGTEVLVPNQPGDFLWMWPQACDPLALKVGESFSNFAPQPPPIGPVALTPAADDALRVIAGSGAGSAATPWTINNTPARERWVVALNGGYDPYQARGRGMALVDLASGHTLWSFFQGDNKSRAQHLGSSISAGLALADVGNPLSTGTDADQLFDTATVGDSGGQLWTLRFWQPGEWNPTTQQVSNWYAARSFRVANLAGLSGSPEALRSPFSTIATNVVQQDTGFLRTFVGTGDSQNVLDLGPSCRLGNPRACAEQGCGAQATLEVYRGGTLAASSTSAWSGYASSNVSSLQAPAGPACAGASVKLSWDYDSTTSCSNGSAGLVEYACDGDPLHWRCRTVRNDWQQLRFNRSTSPFPQRFYGVWSYGGDPSRTFNTDSEANAFESQMLSDGDLLNVGQFDASGEVVSPQVEASPLGNGWYIPYASNIERTGSTATVVEGCVLWSSFEPSPTVPVCTAAGLSTSRLYQANFLSGSASCALGFHSAASDTWARYLRFSTRLPLPDPAPQRQKYGTEIHTQATLSTPHGTVPFVGGVSSSPFVSLPVVGEPQ